MTREEAIIRISRMNAQGLMDYLGRLDCEFKMDFSEEYLSSISIERLRHIAFAASFIASNFPETLEGMKQAI